MADALVSAVLEQLFSIIHQEIGEEVRLVVGVPQDVEKLSCTFTIVQAVIKDAEEKQVNNEPVKLWLEDLKGVAYDMDDLLDEWWTKILLRSHQNESRANDAGGGVSLNKVCTTYLFSPCLCLKRLVIRHNIGHRIKEIKNRLDDISTMINNLRLNTREGREEESKRPETSSLIDVSETFGRDEDKKIIISKLVSESSRQETSSQVTIISIVGIGGLGKTTLAQFAFNDGQVINHFQNRMWVCVSKTFDKVKIAKQIIEAMGAKNVVANAWQALHHQLRNSIHGKHFLLVLDDVWADDQTDWDSWNSLKLSLSHGAKGSRILVTTRNERVAKMMGTTYTHNLETLPDADCWELLRCMAFAGRKEECAELEDIAMKIIKKCKGLPLSVKAIGSVLCFKEKRQEWLHVSESNIWEIPDVGRNVIPALLLSYYDFPSQLKRCFEYCAIFPKNCIIYKPLIIKMWMAQGFLGSNFTAKTEELEMIGEDYFKNLAMRSFFKDFDTFESDGNIISFKMHDLIHDLAQLLTKRECYIMEVNSTNNRNNQELKYRKARHLTLLLEDEEIDTIPPLIYKAKNLRTLRVSGKISSVSSNLFHHLTCLRVLSLRETRLEELLSDVEKLIHLRDLDLSSTRLKELPKTVCNLYNLQSLELNDCRSLCKLPEGIGRLVNLRRLVINECRQLSYLPQGIGKLNSLRILSDFIVGCGSGGRLGCKIREIKDLSHLHGHLKIIGLQRVEDGNEAKEADLKNKEHLHGLGLHFDEYTGVALVADEAMDADAINDDSVSDNDGDDEDDDGDSDGSGDGGDGSDGDSDGDGDEGEHTSEWMEDVLDSLQPHPKLKKLEIHDYLGTKFPNWMVRDDSMLLSDLVYLDIGRWKKCKQLHPALGKLPSLKKLCIAGMDEVKNIGCEFFGIDVDGAARSYGGIKVVFPKLKVLQIGLMLNLKEWNLKIQNEYEREIVIMPCLHYLVISGCPKLKVLPHHLLHATSFRKLLIANCPELTWTSSCCLPSLHLEELVLWGNAGAFSISLSSNSSSTCFPHLKSLTIKTSPYRTLPEGIGQLTALQSLNIRISCSIKSIPEELQHLSMLQKLTIYKCRYLGSRCQKVVGEEWSKISHIPNIEIDGKKI